MDAGNNKAMRGCFHIYLHCWSGEGEPHTTYRIRALPLCSMNLSVAPRPRNTFILVRAPTYCNDFQKLMNYAYSSYLFNGT